MMPGLFCAGSSGPGDSRLCLDLREVDLRHIRKILLANYHSLTQSLNLRAARLAQLSASTYKRLTVDRTKGRFWRNAVIRPDDEVRKMSIASF
jgi:hypothetical protein